MTQLEKTACFTGHRDIPFLQQLRVKAKLLKTIDELVGQGIRYFGAGGATGFDTLAAQAVLMAKRKHPHVYLILVLPFPGQADRWNEHDRFIYEEIKAHADKIRYISAQYVSGVYHQRNRHLVNNSGICVCYLTKRTGGTAYTVDYANSLNRRIINLAE